ncbi:hypothetical protein [Priestia endophytica]|uniref:hypothetical protein n=1 Tax=Priestia endophytica TaxID=135735 RepID=UPI000F545E83|nr:hypothetical protein [Priestia endophytica]MBG9813717.1 hypothetical protein [Priestia endophytica]MCM3537945.1 hypothetical protein [Priestia endophytica]MED4074585.1 hypothetical protein [Priestia endophytica]RPK06082.1 hypothetical protein FH5_01629 [Priestia endophytica]
MKKYKWGLMLLVLAFFIEWSYHFLNYEREVAKNFADKLFSYPLPPKTEITDKGFDYEVLYGEDLWESKDQPTVVAYMRLSSKLSEKELMDYYKENNDVESGVSSLKGFEVKVEEEIENRATFMGEKDWYEELNVNKRNNEENPLELIVQVKNRSNSNSIEMTCS